MSFGEEQGEEVMATKLQSVGAGSANNGGPALTRVFDAPIERVWRAWTDPEQFKRWFGPRGFTIPFCEIDLQVGGKYLTCQRSPAGRDIWATGVYREIDPMERLVLTHASGGHVPATHYGRIEDLPEEEVVILTFEDLGGKTRVTLRQGRATQARSQTLDKLEAVLDGDADAENRDGG